MIRNGAFVLQHLHIAFSIDPLHLGNGKTVLYFSALSENPREVN